MPAASPHPLKARKTAPSPISPSALESSRAAASSRAGAVMVVRSLPMPAARAQARGTVRGRKPPPHGYPATGSPSTPTRHPRAGGKIAVHAPASSGLDHEEGPMTVIHDPIATGVSALARGPLSSALLDTL